MANKVALSTVKAAYAGHKSTLEKAIRGGTIPEGVIPNIHNAALGMTVSQYSGYIVEVDDIRTDIVNGDTIESLLLSASERVALAAESLIPVDVQSEINDLLAQARMKAETVRKLIAEGVGAESAKSLRFPKIPKAFIVTAGRKRGSGGGAKEDRDWSSNTYMKGGTGKAAGFSAKVTERDNDGIPSAMEVFNPAGDSMGIVDNSGGKECWTQAFDLIADAAGINGSSTTNVPDFFGAPKVKSGTSADNDKEDDEG